MDLPWPPRAEEGLSVVDSDTLRYLKQNEPLCPSQKPKSRMAAGGHFGFTKIIYLKKILLK